MVLEETAVRNLSNTTPLRCILLMSGHAAGKTSLVRWGRERVGAAPGYTWHTEGGNGGRRSLSTMPVKDAHDLAWLEWRDPATHTMVVEGTRVYGTIFKVAGDHYDVGRELWILKLLQTPEIMRAHLRARCEAKGKTYRDDYWDRDEYQATYQGADRHINALRKFLPMPRMPSERPYDWEPPLGERLTIWVELGHGNLGPAYTWFAKASACPSCGRRSTGSRPRSLLASPAHRSGSPKRPRDERPRHVARPHPPCSRGARLRPHPSQSPHGRTGVPVRLREVCGGSGR
jgi:hypothetical protein